MATERRFDIRVGSVIRGQYEVVRRLNAGSMGTVYACKNRSLGGKLFALKILAPALSDDPVARQRFQNEVLASYEVYCKHIVRAYEYFEDGELAVLVMEYVTGGDLSKLMVERKRSIPICEIVRILREVCKGLEAIHGAGIVHRDLKPENILLAEDGTVKISDFGIARLDGTPRLTEPGGVIGAIDYLSPEYLAHQVLDQRCDIYALGMLAYQMLTDSTPFVGTSVVDSLQQRLNSDPALPSSLRHDCPAALERIVMKALARKPEERYQTASEMLYELEHLERRRSTGGTLRLVKGKTTSSNLDFIRQAIDPLTPRKVAVNEGVVVEVLPPVREVPQPQVPSVAPVVELSPHPDACMAEVLVEDGLRFYSRLVIPFGLSVLVVCIVALWPKVSSHNPLAPTLSVPVVAERLQVASAPVIPVAWSAPILQPIVAPLSELAQIQTSAVQSAPVWVAQIAAATNVSDAQALAHSVRSLGHSVRIQSVTVSGREFHRVLVGAEASRAAAAQLAEKVRQSGLVSEQPLLRQVQ